VVGIKHEEEEEEDEEEGSIPTTPCKFLFKSWVGDHFRHTSLCGM